MADNSLVDGVRKLFLMQVGAVAVAGEKGAEVANDLIARGEKVVGESKALNEELTRKVKDMPAQGVETLLKAHMSGMSTEEKADFVARIAELAAEAEADSTTVPVEDASDDTTADKD